MNKTFIYKEVDILYKKIYGKLVSSLLYFSSKLEIHEAEDIAQDTFSTAITEWERNGIPKNKEGWIYKVAKNKTYNFLRRGLRIRGFYNNEDFYFEENLHIEGVIDEKLHLLFACAHPGLSPKTQVVITLKYVVNLKVVAIAKALAMSIDGVDKILIRARHKIKEERLLVNLPPIELFPTRVPQVHKILYLIFNEGYKSAGTDKIINENISEEALIMTKLLLQTSMANKDTAALYSLMLFNAARFEARLSAGGELLDLENQNRSLWNKDLILLGCKFLEFSKNDNLSSYHYEAIIAYLHCIAKDFNSTDWITISIIYEKLSSIYNTPFIQLNKAIAMFYAGQENKAKAIFLELKQHPFLNQYYLLNVSLGKVSLKEGNTEMAKMYLTQALEQTGIKEEKNYISKLITSVETCR